MNPRRWLQILLLLVIGQPLVLLAMPCHTSAAEQVSPVHHGEHHAAEHVHAAQAAVPHHLTDAAPPELPGHDCCGAGALCLMSGCTASVFGHPVGEPSVSPSPAVFPHHYSFVPDAPVSPLYRPPIFL